MTLLRDINELKYLRSLDSSDIRYTNKQKIELSARRVGFDLPTIVNM